MNAYQMITYSAYLIFTADYNGNARKVLNSFRNDPDYTKNRIKK